MTLVSSSESLLHPGPAGLLSWDSLEVPPSFDMAPRVHSQEAGASLRSGDATCRIPFHPRGFSPPRWLTPRAVVRVCSAPLPNMGFATFRTGDRTVHAPSTHAVVPAARSTPRRIPLVDSRSRVTTVPYLRDVTAHLRVRRPAQARCQSAVWLFITLRFARAPDRFEPTRARAALHRPRRSDPTRPSTPSPRRDCQLAKTVRRVHSKRRFPHPMAVPLPPGPPSSATPFRTRVPSVSILFGLLISATQLLHEHPLASRASTSRTSASVRRRRPVLPANLEVAGASSRRVPARIRAGSWPRRSSLRISSASRFRSRSKLPASSGSPVVPAEAATQTLLHASSRSADRRRAARRSRRPTCSTDPRNQETSVPLVPYGVGSSSRSRETSGTPSRAESHPCSGPSVPP